MNETISSILNRRSIRRYLPEQIRKEDLEQIVRAGLYAPSARNKQPWHLTVVCGHELLTRLTAEVKSATLRMPDNHYAAMVQKEGYSVAFGAPILVIVSGNSADAPMVRCDCSLVLGNIFLAAHSLGIGSCWVNQLGILSDEPGFRTVLESLNVPARNTVYGCAALGYPRGAHPAAPARRENTVNYVTANQ
ncbi:MAG: nitroreductase family protein [Desulfovibrio sp.]|jgi:nitroreductase|nr:nitroreductase family protein [Desulfovibrio sp.]